MNYNRLEGKFEGDHGARFDLTVMQTVVEISVSVAVLFVCEPHGQVNNSLPKQIKTIPLMRPLLYHAMSAPLKL